MKKEPSNFDHRERTEIESVQAAARTLDNDITKELNRIRKRDGDERWSTLYYEVYAPKSIGGVNVDRATLMSTIFYHTFIGSTPPNDCPLLDLPGDQNLMAYAKRKLEELKQM
jgi:hypothetical protein